MEDGWFLLVSGMCSLQEIFYPWMPFVNHQIVDHISTRVVDGGVIVVEVLSSVWNPA